MGSWYPSRPDRLGQQLDQYLRNVDVEVGLRPVAVIAPHAGLMYSGPVAAFAYKTPSVVRRAAAVLVGPSHFIGFEGVSIWPRGAWETPFGEVAVADAIAERIMSASREVIDHRAAHRREHSIELQLPFIAHLM